MIDIDDDDHHHNNRPQPRPCTIETMILDVELTRASDAQLAEMRDRAQAQVERCARLAGLALDTGAAVRRKVLTHEAMAHDELVRRVGAEIDRRVQVAA